MSGTNLMQSWVHLLGALAGIAIIVVAIGLMLGIVRPADVPRHIGTVLVIVVGLMVAPGILASVWSAMALWQQISLFAVGAVVLMWLRPRRQSKERSKQ